jgi:hypothetical protein
MRNQWMVSIVAIATLGSGCSSRATVAGLIAGTLVMMSGPVVEGATNSDSSEVRGVGLITVPPGLAIIIGSVIGGAIGDHGRPKPKLKTAATSAAADLQNP